MRIWDIRTPKLELMVDAHRDPITSVEFSLDDTVILSSSMDGFCRFWDWRPRLCLKTVVGSGMESVHVPVSSATFSNNGKYILTSTWDSSVRLFDVDACNAVRSYEGHVAQKYLINSAFVVLEDKSVFVLSGSEDGNVFLWNLQGMDVAMQESAHDGVVVSVSANVDGTMFSSGGLDGVVNIWSIEEIN
jgi:COMPASS component SWD3